VRAADRWAEALAAWAIPDDILARAPESPWVHPPAMFRLDESEATAMPSTPSFRWAALALERPGAVLDVGCGGGRSSIPLGPGRVTRLVGVDEQPAMLEQFGAAARAAGIPATGVTGRWPDVAGGVGTVDVVVCHHVAYNVADIRPFVRALSDHAARRVVVELPERHPTAPFTPLWQRFWGLERPTEPSAALFVDVVGEELGVAPVVERWERAPRRASVALEGDDERAAYVAFVRRRLCLTADRDDEVAAALDELGPLTVGEVVTVTWTPT
jgi:SAM-dependent methyltransferase